MLKPHQSHSRMHALDGMRAVMMLLGLVLHTVVSYVVVDLGDAWPYKDSNTTTWVADLVVGYIHVFRMPVFFVLAGFFSALLYLRRGVKGFVVNRAVRIGIPLVAGLIILYPLVVSGFTFSNVANVSSIAQGLNVVAESARTAALYIPDSTLHLWFIYDLLYFYLAAVILVPICRCIPSSGQEFFLKLFKGIVAQPVLRVLVPALITMLTLLPMQGTLRTSSQFQPDVEVLLAYGVFFGFGWLLYYCQELLPKFVRFAWSKTFGALFLYLFAIIFYVPLLSESQGQATVTVFLAFTGGIVAWLSFFGMTGLFLRYLNKSSKVIRYIVDASYWVYLIHLPCTIWIPGLLVGADLSVWIKMLIVVSCTAIIGFVSYDFFVRSSFVGKLLNGRRYVRGLPD